MNHLQAAMANGNPQLCEKRANELDKKRKQLHQSPLDKVTSTLLDQLDRLDDNLSDEELHRQLAISAAKVQISSAVISATKAKEKIGAIYDSHTLPRA